MPRVVNAEQQRTHIVEAVWRLLEQAGLEAVSLRDVATEAGVSMGRVQHYFATKDEMLLFGLQLAQQRLETRVEKRLMHLAQTTAESILREVLDELLGENADTRQMLLVSVAFYLRARVDPKVAAVLSAGDAEILDLAVAAIVEAQAAGRASQLLSPPLEAQILLTLATSLGVEVAIGQRTIGDARSTLAYALDRTFGHVPKADPAGPTSRETRERSARPRR